MPPNSGGMLLLPQQFLNFWPEPQSHGSLRPCFAIPVGTRPKAGIGKSAYKFLPTMPRKTFTSCGSSGSWLKKAGKTLGAACRTQAVKSTTEGFEHTCFPARHKKVSSWLSNSGENAVTLAPVLDCRHDTDALLGVVCWASQLQIPSTMG